MKYFISLATIKNVIARISRQLFEECLMLSHPNFRLARNERKKERKKERKTAFRWYSDKDNLNLDRQRDKHRSRTNSDR